MASDEDDDDFDANDEEELKVSLYVYLIHFWLMFEVLRYCLSILVLSCTVVCCFSAEEEKEAAAKTEAQGEQR